MSPDGELVPTALGRLAVRTVGNGPPAVLWHSFFVDSRTWDPVVPALAEDRTVVIIDGPGFGDSDPLTRVHSIDDCAGAAFEVLQHLGVGSVDWVGNAWGGHVGIALGAMHPEAVRSLVSIGAPVHALGTKGGSERRKSALLRPVARVVGLPSPLMGAVLAALLNDAIRRDDPQAVATVVSGARRPTRRSFDFALRSFVLGRTDLTDAALSLTMPVLFAAGDDRGEWTPSESAEITSRMPNARTVTLHAVRGIAPLEDPAGVIDLVRDFWRSLDRR